MRLVFEQNIPSDLDIGGYVYVLGFGDKTKIGVTKSPTQRIKTLENSGGQRVQTTNFSQPLVSPRFYESACHQLLKDSRSLGEYFSLPVSDVLKALSQHEFPEVAGREDTTADDALMHAFWGWMRLKELESPIENIFAPVAAAVSNEIVCLLLEKQAEQRGYSIEMPRGEVEGELVEAMALAMKQHHLKIYDDAMQKDFGETLSSMVHIVDGRVSFRRKGEDS